MEELRRQRNQASEEVARLKKAGEEASEQIDQLSRVSDRIKELAVTEQPEIPHVTVPEPDLASYDDLLVEVAQ